MRTAFLVLVLIVAVRVPAWSQEATAVGLKGPVHTVLTDEFNDADGTPNRSSGSTFDIYDRQGYQVELYRYKPDGSLWVHTIFERNGAQIFRSQTIGTGPFENSLVRNFFDAEGHVIETDTYDGDGNLLKKSTSEFLQKEPGSTVYRSKESNADGTENTREVVDSTDPKTGITHQISTMNGKPETDWLIQRNDNGKPEKDKIVMPDGSYNERERRPDGTTVEDRYSATAKSHTYQKSDAQGHLIEVIQESDSSYIRCTYSFDEDGQPTGQINYDAFGKILDKSTVEYRGDAHGNWIEKKEVVWDTKSEPMKQRIVSTSFRTIDYY
jgi:hypothetical protein